MHSCISSFQPHVLSLLGHMCLHCWDTCAFTAGTHVPLLLGHMCLHCWDTRAFTAGTHVLSLLGHMCFHCWDTCAFTAGTHVPSLLGHMCWDTGSREGGGLRILHIITHYQQGTLLSQFISVDCGSVLKQGASVVCLAAARQHTDADVSTLMS
jgi:hypothetical protein